MTDIKKEYAYFYSHTNCFRENEAGKTCGGELEMAFNLKTGEVDYVWCPKCLYLHYKNKNYKV